MSLFEPVILTWGDEDFTVPPERVMGLVEVVEDVITLEELMNSKGNKRAKLSRAFASALRYAGAKVDDESVYTTMFGASAGVSIGAAVSAILMMMIPPEHMRKKDAPVKKPQRKAAKDL